MDLELFFNKENNPIHVPSTKISFEKKEKKKINSKNQMNANNSDEKRVINVVTGTLHNQHKNLYREILEKIKKFG